MGALELALARRTGENVFLVEVTVRHVTGSTTTRILRFSDRPIDILGVVYDPGVVSLARIENARAPLTRPGYFLGDLRLELASRHHGEQLPTHTLIDTFTAWEFHNAPVTVRLHPVEAGDLALAVWSGVVDQIDELTPTRVVLRCVGADETGYSAAVNLIRETGTKPSIDDQNDVIPILGGEIGFSEASFLADIAAAPVLTPLAWEQLAPTRGGSQAKVIDTVERVLRVSSLPIRTTGLPNDLRLGVQWPDTPGAPSWFPDLAPADYDTDEATITVPITTLSSATPFTVGATDVVLRRLHIPRSVTAATAAAWTTPEAALDHRNLHTYAEVGDATKWQSEGRFLDYPSDPGKKVPSVGNGGFPASAALVQVSGLVGSTHDLTLEYYEQDRPSTRTSGTSFHNLAAGIYLVTWYHASHISHIDIKTQDAGAWNGRPLGTERSEYWGESGGEGIRLWGKAGQTTRLHVYGWIWDHLVPAEQGFAGAPGAIGSGSRGLRDAKPAKFWFHGYALGDSVDITNPGDVVPELLIKATVGSSLPLSSGDFNVAASTFGSWTDLASDLDTKIAAVTSGDFTEWVLSVIEAGDVPLEDILAEVSNSVGVHIWKDPGGKYNAVMKRADAPSTHSKTLTADDVVIDPDGALRISCVPQPITEIWNAVECQFWREGNRLTETVFIDATASRDHSGGTSALGEALAASSQARYGRRVKRIKAQYVRDPGAAWERLTRFSTLSMVRRQRLRFEIPIGWIVSSSDALLSGGGVIGTDASLDDLLQWPGYDTAGVETSPSWAGRLFWVENVGILSTSLAEVTALEIDEEEEE